MEKYFAKVDVLYRVLQVIVADQDYVDTLPGMWIPCEGTTNYPGIGYTFDPNNNAFIAPKLYSSWVLGSDFKWHAPVDVPDNVNSYIWNEQTGMWEITQ